MSALSDIHAHLPPRTNGPRRDPDDEPFGQRGVRQYMGVVVHWLCIIALSVAATFWWRGAKVYDRFEWRGTDARVRISSGIGRVEVEANTFIPSGGRALGWIYHARNSRKLVDMWQPSTLKTIGIEFFRGPTRTDATGGFVFRVKWYFIIGMLAIVPVYRCVARWVHRVRDPGDEVE